MGHARHGKDTVAEFIHQNYGLTFTSSSRFVCERAVFPVLAMRYGYETPEQCYDDRANHRAEWHDLIWEYNRADPANLARELYTKFDIYTGIRQRREFYAIRNEGLYHSAIWVDAFGRMPIEPPDSINVEPWMADYWIDNTGTLQDLYRNIRTLMEPMLL
jgi:hypothetical protein